MSARIIQSARHATRGGRNKAAGKFSELKAFARSGAARMHAKTRSITLNSVRAMADAIFKCSMRVEMSSRRSRMRI